MFDYIQLIELYIIEFIQNKLQDYGEIFVWLSVVCDPGTVYSIYFPFLYGLCPRLSLKVLYGVALGEWINLSMKWVFNGHRPFWYQGEIGAAGADLKIQQYFNTCETGPGNPSGHQMIMAMVWYVICDFLSQKAAKKERYSLGFLVWSTYAVLVTLVGISRIFIAAHFPHQCILGLACGVALGSFVSKIKLDHLPLRHYLILEVFIIFSMLLINFTLQVAGFDPNWSVVLAEKWCINPEWIHTTTSPYFTPWRFTAGVFGVGFVTTSAIYHRILKSPLPLIFGLLLSASAIFVAYMSTFLILTSFGEYVLYGSTFLTYMAMICVTGISLPKLLFSLGT